MYSLVKLMNSLFGFDVKEKLKQAAIYFNSMPEEEQGIQDCLTIGVDISPNDVPYITVMRRVGNDTFVVNRFVDDEAIALYNKLIGKDE